MIEASADVSEKIVGHAVLERTDVQQALRHGILPKIVRGYAVMVVVGPFLMYFQLRALGGTIDWLQFAPMLAYGVVFVGALAFAHRRMVNQVLGEKPASERDTRYEVDVSGYSIETASSSSRSGWQSVQHYREVESAFLIFLNPTVQLIWPKRAFAASDLPRLRAVLAAHVAPRQANRVWRRILFVWVVLIVLAVALQLTGWLSH